MNKLREAQLQRLSGYVAPPSKPEKAHKPPKHKEKLVDKENQIEGKDDEIERDEP